MQKKQKILVIGDLILDVHHHGNYIGQSLSTTTTPVARNEFSTYTWGGAGFLVRNILALGGSVSFISTIGTDDFARKINSFKHPGLTKLFIRTPLKPTVVKERFWLEGTKHLGWYHYDNTHLSTPQEQEVMRLITQELSKVEKVVVADYRHGLLSRPLARYIIASCKKLQVPVYIDSQVSYDKANHLWYKGATLFCINQKEAQSIDDTFGQPNVSQSLQRFKKALNTQNLILKLGEKGSVMTLRNSYFETPAHPVTVIDPSGAGDAFLARIVLGNYPPLPRDLAEASIWAALSTTLPGTELPSLTEYKNIVSKL